MKDGNKTKAELLKELKLLREEQEKRVFKNIFEYKEAEKGLKEPEEEYQKLFENMMDGLVLHRLITDKNGRPVDYILEKVNKAAEKVLSWNRKDIEGKKATEVYSGDTPFIERYAKVAQTGKAEYFVDYYPRFKKWYEINSFCPKKGYFANIFRDITERKDNEQRLKQYRFIVENAHDAIFFKDLKSRYVIANNKTLEAFGLPQEEVIGKDDMEIMTNKEEAKVNIEGDQVVFRTGKPKIIDKHMTGEDGKEYWFESIKVPQFDDKGNTIGLICIARDTTERKQAEEKIKHLNLVLRAIRSVNQLIVKEKNRKSLLKGACNNLIKTRGYYRAWIALLDESGKLETYAEAGIRKAFLPIVEMLMKGELTVCGQKALKQQKVVITEDTESTCTECPLAQEYSGRGAMTIRLEYNGKIYGLITVSIPAHLAVDKEERSLFKEVAEDIAFSIHNIESDEERIQAEENVKNIKDELEMLLNSVPAIIFYKDTEGRIIRANKAFADALKLPMKDIVGKTTEEIVPKEQAENMRKDDKEVMVSGKPKRDIIQPCYTPEGTRWVITDKMPHKDKEGKITGVISLSKDITVQKKTEQKLKNTMDAALDTVSKIIEAKDPYTSGHQHRVCQLATRIAREMKLPEDKIEGIRIASLIHDIGKIGLPAEILSKPSKLTDIEFSLIKGHSQIGYNILKSIDFSYPIARIVLQHHERLDGSGYPNNLKGDKILLEARILGVADVVEAMSSHRPYRPALGIDVALEEISKNRGVLYDPEVVGVCLRLFKEKGFKFK